jgi:branched-chain amino acid transport system substrate-binding protein
MEVNGMKKILLVLLVAVFLFGSLTLAAESGVGVYEDKVVIGSFQALSGPVAPIGVSMRKGMDAYFNWVNNNGGVYGRKIELIVADDAFNPSKTVVEVKRMVEQDNVFAIVGGLGTPGCLAVMDYLNENKVPFVYQGSGVTTLSIPPKEYVFTVQPNYVTEGQIMGKYLVEELGKERIGIVYRADDAGRDEFDALKYWLNENGYPSALVGKMPVDVNKTSFDNEILKLMQLNVDAVVLSMWLPQSPNFLKQAHEYGLDVLMVGSYPNADPNVVQLAGEEAAEGFRATAWVMGDIEDDYYQKYVSIYQETFPDEIPNAYAAAGFVAGEVFTEALKRAGENPTRDKLLDALESFDEWAGIIAPPLTYRPYDPEDTYCRTGLRNMYVMEVIDGVWTGITDWISVAE